MSPISSRISSQSFALISSFVFRDDNLRVLVKVGTICLQTIWKQEVLTDDAFFMIAQVQMQNIVWLSADYKWNIIIHLLVENRPFRFSFVLLSNCLVFWFLRFRNYNFRSTAVSKTKKSDIAQYCKTSKPNEVQIQNKFQWVSQSDELVVPEITKFRQLVGFFQHNFRRRLPEKLAQEKIWPDQRELSVGMSLPNRLARLVVFIGMIFLCKKTVSQVFLKLCFPTPFAIV